MLCFEPTRGPSPAGKHRRLAPPGAIPVTKHLVWLLIGFVALSGCRHEKDQKAVSPVGPLPAGSFAREWTAQLDLKNDPVRSLHVLRDWVFVYTRKNVSYGLRRAGGALEFISDVNVSGGVL